MWRESLKPISQFHSLRLCAFFVNWIQQFKWKCGYCLIDRYFEMYVQIDCQLTHNCKRCKMHEISAVEPQSIYLNTWIGDQFRNSSYRKYSTLLESNFCPHFGISRNNSMELELHYYCYGHCNKQFLVIKGVTSLLASYI